LCPSIARLALGWLERNGYEVPVAAQRDIDLVAPGLCARAERHQELPAPTHPLTRYEGPREAQASRKRAVIAPGQGGHAVHVDGDHLARWRRKGEVADATWRGGHAVQSSWESLRYAKVGAPRCGPARLAHGRSADHESAPAI